MINIAAPLIEEQEIEAVNEVLKTGIVAQGPVVARFEEEFAKFCGAKFSVAVNSGTAAIHCALHAAGVGPGDEVITTPFTFIASLNPILMVGATPKLVDISSEDFNIDTDKVEGAITKKTKALLGVDLYGQPCDFAKLSPIAKEHNLKLIEDACQAVGAQYGDKKAGDLGDVGCFSLYATKNIMSAEGGMVTTNDAGIAAAVKRFRQHGMTGPYEYAELGYNYRMTDVLAAIGLAQLRKADKFTAARQRNAETFDRGLAEIPGIITPKVLSGRTHVYHQYTIRVTSDSRYGRQELMAKLKERGIGSGIYYPKPLHYYPHVAALGYEQGDFPVAERLANEVLSLPVHPSVCEQDASRIVDAMKELLNA